MTNTQTHSPQGAPPKEAGKKIDKARQSEALRANLRRRKQASKPAAPQGGSA